MITHTGTHTSTYLYTRRRNTIANEKTPQERDEENCIGSRKKTKNEEEKEEEQKEAGGRDQEESDVHSRIRIHFKRVQHVLGHLDRVFREPFHQIHLIQEK